MSQPLPQQQHLDSRAMFGAKGNVDPLADLIGAATGWEALPRFAGGLQERPPFRRHQWSPFVLINGASIGIPWQLNRVTPFRKLRQSSLAH